MKVPRRLCVLLFCIFVYSTALAQQLPRGITAEDYFSFEFVSDPRISPDGKLVAFVVTKVERAQNRRNSAIWMVPADGSRAPWQFTTSPQSATSPRWSPDGQSLAFLSTRPTETGSGSGQEQVRAQLSVLSMGGCSAKRVTNLKHVVTNFHDHLTAIGLLLSVALDQ